MQKDYKKPETRVGILLLNNRFSISLIDEFMCITQNQYFFNKKINTLASVFDVPCMK